MSEIVDCTRNVIALIQNFYCLRMPFRKVQATVEDACNLESHFVGTSLIDMCKYLRNVLNGLS